MLTEKMKKKMKDVVRHVLTIIIYENNNNNIREYTDTGY